MRLKDITCLSDLYYVIGRWFTFGMVALAFVMLPMALDRSETVFAFAMCAGVMFVGVAAQYRDKTVYPVHAVSAIVSAVCSVVWVSIVSPWCLQLVFIGFVGAMDRKRWLLWCEVGCLVAAMASLV